MNGKPKFRNIIQSTGLDKIKNNPMKRLKKGVVLAPSPSGDKADVGGSEGQSGTPTESGSFLKSSPYTLINDLRRFRIDAQTTELMRAKLRESAELASQTLERLRIAAAASSPLKTSKEPRHKQDESKEQKEDDDTYLGQFQSSIQEAKEYYNCIPFDHRWDEITASLGVLGRMSTGNTVTPYHDSAIAFHDMWAAVDTATSRVRWQTYICKDDHVGQKTVAKLVAAHQRGCATELLYDCGGNISGRGRLTEDLKQCGARVIPYRPFFASMLDYFFKGLDWHRSPGLRNHRKILLVDSDKVGFCGGLNVGNEYCGKAEGGTGKFRDTHCRIQGPAASHLAEVYEDTLKPQPWKYGWRRWRQITRMELQRRLNVGRVKVERSLLMQAFNKETQRSGKLNLGSVSAASVKVARSRWKKQKEQLYALVSGKRLFPDTPTEEAAQTESPADSQLRAVLDTHVDVEGVIGKEVPSRAMKSNPQEGSVEAGDAPRTAEQKERAEGTSTSQSSRISNGISGAMQRKMMAARRRALFSATDLPHKRAYTRLLLQATIQDTEPVPEAEMYAKQRHSRTQIVSCNPRYRDYSIQYVFWQVTRKCHRRIWITTPYYLPTRKLFWALIQAAERGVDVRMLAGSSRTTDPWWMWHASNFITQRLLRAGVKIYEFKGSGIMHAKTVVVDSIWSSIGSYNWDLMSNRNLEVCMCHLDFAFAKEMEEQFLRDLSESKEVKLEEHQQRSLFLRFTSWMFYNFVFLLDRITFRSFSSEDINDSPQIPRDQKKK